MTNSKKILDDAALLPPITEQIKQIVESLEYMPVLELVHREVLPMLKAILIAGIENGTPFKVAFISNINGSLKMEKGEVAVFLVAEDESQLEVTFYVQLVDKKPRFSMGIGSSDEVFCKIISEKIARDAKTRGHGVAKFQDITPEEAWERHLKGTH